MRFLLLQDFQRIEATVRAVDSYLRVCKFIAKLYHKMSMFHRPLLV